VKRCCMKRRMSQRSGPKDLTARLTETIDTHASNDKMRETIAPPLLARLAGMVWRRRVRTLFTRERQARCGARSPQCGRVLSGADQSPLFTAQPLLLTVLAFPSLSSLKSR
jgi:hypothetical protein